MGDSSSDCPSQWPMHYLGSMANGLFLSLLRRVSDILMRYTQEAITGSGESLEFPVRANSLNSPDMKSGSQMEQVFRLMRQSSAGVNLISHKSDQHIMEGYLYMKKGLSVFSINIPVLYSLFESFILYSIVYSGLGTHSFHANVKWWKVSWP